MTVPILVSRDALDGISVALSVSDSADLSRLGLDTRHAELAIGELTRTVLVAGGRVVYGGRIKPSGFTQQLMGEVQRFGTGRHSLTICLASPEHRKLSRAEIDGLDRDLGTWGRLVTLDLDGKPIAHAAAGGADDTELSNTDRTRAYTGLRHFTVDGTHARVLVGGQLRGSEAAMPGIIEEAILSVEQRQPLYVAGGFGGAAALVAEHLGLPMDWLPPDVPEGRDDPTVEHAINRLGRAVEVAGWAPELDGLTSDERALLAGSHRPADVASLAVRGIARQFQAEQHVEPDGGA